MRKTPLLALAALLLLAPPLAGADELIRFKSGYEMMAVSHRVEGDMVIVVLPDGGEVGFKKEIVDLLEGNKESARTGPSPLWNRVPRRINDRRFEAPAAPEELPSRFLARGSTSYNGQTVGYNYHDQKFERFSGGPIGEVNGAGRIGVDVRNRNATPRSPDYLGDRPTAKPPKSTTHIFQADIPTRGE